jgi:hypothetical protein
MSRAKNFSIFLPSQDAGFGGYPNIAEVFGVVEAAFAGKPRSYRYGGACVGARLAREEAITGNK